MHVFALVHATLASSPRPFVALGLATIDHAFPFQRSTSVE
jgi:hypothetical protein